MEDFLTRLIQAYLLIYVGWFTRGLAQDMDLGSALSLSGLFG